MLKGTGNGFPGAAESERQITEGLAGNGILEGKTSRRGLRRGKDDKSERVTGTSDDPFCKKCPRLDSNQHTEIDTAP